MLHSLEGWLKDNILQVLPKSPIVKAIAYSQLWKKLSNYSADCEVEIDNKLVENAICPLALGRKNYLFAGSHEVAQRAAMIYSLSNACKKNNIEPWNWLTETLTRLPDHKANKLHELLPVKQTLRLQQN